VLARLGFKVSKEFKDHKEQQERQGYREILERKEAKE
jgi:hypothetical protein